MNILKNKQQNWLLKIGIFFYIAFTIFQILQNNSDITTSRTLIETFNNLSFFVSFLFIVVLAPIYEEFIFRGVFSTNKFVLIVASIILPIVVSVVLYSNYKNWISYLGISMTLSATVANYFIKKSKAIKTMIYILFALFFSLIHWSIQDFKTFSNLYLLLPHFSLALILTWITLNYNLVKSILTHIVYNLVLFLLGSASLIFFDNTLQKKEINNSMLEWQKTSFFSNESVLKTNSNGYTFKETTLIDINKLFLNNKLNKYHFTTNPFQNFNINFKVKSDSITYEKMQDLFINCLEKSEIIKK